jgi:molybdopterin molybdotransferase
MMISFEQANNILLEAIKPLGTERVPLLHSLHRILAEDYISDSDVPPFNKSAMDGFACRKSELNNILKVVANIPAGVVPPGPLERNECMSIMTGGMVPEGADHILKKEDAEEIEAGRVKCRNLLPESNICLKGEDLRKGDLVLKSGCLIGPQHIAVLASGGRVHPLVYRQPTLAVISTGNELVKPENQPELSQIRDSNGYQLTAQAMLLGLKPDYLGIARDDKEVLTAMFSSALNKYQVIIISGGVSVGDLDYVPEVLQKLGVKILFHRMKVKPGKHLLFGIRENQYIFGFPGNPVSSFVQFEVLVKPFLMKWMGYGSDSLVLSMALAERYSRGPSDVLLFLPVFFTSQGTVSIVEYHGSAHIHAYTQAHGMMEIPAGVSDINKGELVHVRPL